MRSFVSIICIVFILGCGRGGPPSYDVDFEIPRTEPFAASLKDYRLFIEPLSELTPAEGVHFYELSSELFTDYAHKQRLVRVPAGSPVATGVQPLSYPEGTVLAKTFFYPEDPRDENGARRIIETRLLVKTAGQWNVATYLWNEEQTDATLLLEGTTTEVSWIGEDGRARTTEYAVPHEGECVTCHQVDGKAALIGPTRRNLNTPVLRGGEEVNQLEYLASRGVFEANSGSAPTLPDYRDTGLSIETRARAYLDINCAHCHNPSGWDEAADRDFDFRFEASLEASGLRFDGRRAVRALEDGEMPYLGTTVEHDEGIRLIADYVDSL